MANEIGAHDDEDHDVENQNDNQKNKLQESLQQDISHCAVHREYRRRNRRRLIIIEVVIVVAPDGVVINRRTPPTNAVGEQNRQRQYKFHAQVTERHAGKHESRLPQDECPNTREKLIASLDHPLMDPTALDLLPDAEGSDSDREVRTKMYMS